MKFLRLGDAGQEVPCVLDQNGVARDIRSVAADIGPDTIDGLQAKLANADLTALPEVSSDGARVSSPMAQPRNIYCIGLNYSDHAAEAGLPIPDEPILFTKSSGTFCAPNDPILHSPKMTKLDWEVELGIVIGKSALNITKAEAKDHILGYTLVNDVSERAWQQERSGQWSKGKSFPNFCPTGPMIVTGDEVGDAAALPMWLDVNGQRMQTGNTDTMIFDCQTIVSYLSEFLRLEPGDLICTGTPPGVGAGMKPQVWLNPGDVVRLGIDGLGEQTQTVVAL
ncbi:fumarylacetoacetate hydrolase family protein [Sulfitobacter mediterraneus]|uniref:fumarylacetoacetate hydrolase family protein n=1 Tax=Sulfitobacter mediterraneus TaxID=83219 RepID=UPI000EA12377|nr:fumarylacetoacetate hydrolase family protein [Sulfitobacter mediterraneus]MBM1557493.1 fumarylacetoacetate hydrolase family protein [Sulfitobacter mediterraneus]MBM1569222.1 fumarylacetoacetate hydrolase family protein [Sulfitobacter mediterraneus]MBM1572666.1 fumarylacetoacetate hydrolase family protein [Sulfitobacter mediterraneus]MBM1576829.1 fumarylacetoacetate hydrolase family protein [Sulfitobacter mediterraneus]MBM1580671.1 fumarylacetoacetate hydrolase family protein [Sulfitobacter 